MLSKFIHMFCIGVSIAGYPAGYYNRLTPNAPNVGTFHGTCTCPDGSVYIVGDNVNQCGSLACYGGVSGTCHKSNVAVDHIQGLMVECNVVAPSPPPSPPPSSPPSPSPPPSPLSPGYDYVEMFTSDISTSFIIAEPDLIDPGSGSAIGSDEGRRLLETAAISPLVFEYAIYTAFRIMYNVPRFHPDCGLIESTSNKCIDIMYDEDTTNSTVKVYISPNMNSGDTSITDALSTESGADPIEAIVDIFNKIIIGEDVGSSFFEVSTIDVPAYLYAAFIATDDNNTLIYNISTFTNRYNTEPDDLDDPDVTITFINPTSTQIVNKPADDDDDDDDDGLSDGDVAGIIIAAIIGLMFILIIAFVAWPKNSRVCVRRDPEVISTTPTPGLETVSPPTEREIAVATQPSAEVTEITMTEP
ncbi:hypothetical protein EPVG_00413 [Emiliania huxleyi virus 201]|nr:hypothetical protein ELVG_00446 [Emiliania huxleyi virus 203]AET98300.1 hypothetical protein EPVG_00413 [Emiliania huxleyi virus 201]